MSLVENINARKKAGTSRSKANSTISDKAYADMKAGWKKKGAYVGKSKKNLNHTKCMTKMVSLIWLILWKTTYV